MENSDPWSPVPSAGTHGEDYQRGRRFAASGNWRAALDCFSRALQQVDAFHENHPLYLSAKGLARAMLGQRSGLNLCRQALTDAPEQVDLYENLARACVELEQRKKAVDALAKGLRLAPSHNGLRTLQQHMGYRHRPIIPGLGRENPINRFLGRLRYRHQPV